MIRAFFDRQKQNGTEIHDLVIYKGEEKIVSVSASPYSVNDRNHVYSLSKSFCSTAVGLLYDRGLLSPGERIADIFPDKIPENADERFRNMTLSHVLSMNTGHSACVMTQMMAAEDPVAAFFAQPLSYEPGSHFAYNTGATFLASAAVTRRTGLSVLEVLERYLFRDMGITSSEWFSKNGISEGGVGFHVSCEDAAKLGVLYLNEGMWNGRRLLSREWVRTASAIHSSNEGNGTPDWCAGYGYQFWRNAEEGYRGDGAFGQLCMIYPKYGMVAAVIAESASVQEEINEVNRLVMELASSDCKPQIGVLSGINEPGTFDTAHLASAFAGKMYRMEPNRCGITSVHLDAVGGGEMVLSVSSSRPAWRGGIFAGGAAMEPTVSRIDRVRLVSGEWTPGRMEGMYAMPTLDAFTATHDAAFTFDGAAEIGEDGSVTATLCGHDCPHRVTWQITAEGERITVIRRSIRNGGYDLVLHGTAI